MQRILAEYPTHSNGGADHDDNLPLTILIDLVNLVLITSRTRARMVALKDSLSLSLASTECGGGNPIHLSPLPSPRLVLPRLQFNSIEFVESFHSTVESCHACMVITAPKLMPATLLDLSLDKLRSTNCSSIVRQTTYARTRDGKIFKTVRWFFVIVEFTQDRIENN